LAKRIATLTVFDAGLKNSLDTEIFSLPSHLVVGQARAIYQFISADFFIWVNVPKQERSRPLSSVGVAVENVVHDGDFGLSLAFPKQL
jgi:hypothetical protein